MVNVEGHPGLVRDETNSAIVSTSQDEFVAFMAQYSAKRKELDRINLLEQQVNEQGQKLDLILELLRGK